MILHTHNTHTHTHTHTHTVLDITQIQSGELSCDEFDVCMCSPSVYDKVKKCDRILKAKTPSPRKGTEYNTPFLS